VNLFSALRSGDTAYKMLTVTKESQSRVQMQSAVKTQNTQSSATDTVSISNAGADFNQASSYYARFFPSREGMGTEAIINGILHPGYVSSSQGKTFQEVAEDARNRMDNKYAQMNNGAPYDSKNLKDVYSLMGDLDRRSLYAVSSNKGGLFSKEEQQAAAFIMNQQQSMATGIYSGLPEFEKDFSDLFGKDIVGRIKAGLEFLNSASEEEKQSAYWQRQRASLVQALQAQTDVPATDETDDKKNERHLILAELIAQWSQPTEDSKDSNSDESTKNLYEKITGGLSS
jgi:hypothetical protein